MQRLDLLAELKHTAYTCASIGRPPAAGSQAGDAAAFDAAHNYARQREAFGQTISKHQFIQGYLAEMSTQLSAARLMTYHAAWLKDQGKRVTMEGSQAKLFSSEIATRVCNLAVQIHGGYGYVEDFPVERFLRDVKLGEIGEGTSEIQKLVIARELGL